MPSFAYKGRNPRGELIEGRLDSSDSGAVADQLITMGITPVDIKPAAGSELLARQAPEIMRRWLRPAVKLVDLMLFSRQMYTLLKSGVPIMRALAGLQESATNPSLREVIGDLRADLDSGRELSVSMRGHPEVFSPFYVSLVRVGETTGNLENVFLRLAEHLEFEKEIRERISSALRYPMFVVFAMAGAMVIINVVVMPAFAKLFRSFNAPLPPLTRILIGISEFTINYWPLLVVAIVVTVVAFRVWRSTPGGRYEWDRRKLRIPIAGKIVMKATLARFARSFALSTKSGVPIVQGLTTVAGVLDNDYLAQRVHRMREGVERGESVLRTASAAGIFTPMVLQMIAVGDETGELDALMLEVAQFYEREVDYEVKTLASQIEPVLVVILGVMVAILALGVFLPIWDLSKVALKR